MSAIEEPKSPTSPITPEQATTYTIPLNTTAPRAGGPWAATGAGSPQWAALIALADQGRALRASAPWTARPRPSPGILGMPESNFNDIITGSNGTVFRRPGYDLVTGMGTPIAPAMIASLVGSQHSVASTSSTNTVLDDQFQRNPPAARHHHGHAAAAPIDSTTLPWIFSAN